MKKRYFSFSIIACILMFSFLCYPTILHAACNHDWSNATCTQASYCRICGETKGSPIPHKFKNLSDGSKQCVYCRYVEKTESEKPECKYCKIFFDSQEELDNHIKQKHPATKKTAYTGGNGNYTKRVQNWDCRACGYHCTNAASYLEHNQAAHSTTGTCSICGATYKDLNEFTQHWTQAHGGSSYSQISTNVWNEYKNTGTVNVSGMTDGSYRCGECGITFSSYPEFREHKILAHSQNEGNIQIVCPYCSTIFNDIEDYHNHYLSEHYTTINIYKCGICGVEFNSESEFNVHMAQEKKYFDITHNSGYECPYCHKKYDKYGWTNCVVNHLKELYPSSFYCRTCDKYFDSEKELRNHVENENILAQQQIDEYNAWVEMQNEYIKKHNSSLSTNKNDKTNSVENKNSFICTKCNKELNNSSEYYKHLTSEHKEDLNEENINSNISNQHKPNIKYIATGKVEAIESQTGKKKYMYINQYSCMSCNKNFNLFVGVSDSANENFAFDDSVVYNAHIGNKNYISGALNGTYLIKIGGKYVKCIF